MRKKSNSGRTGLWIGVGCLALLLAGVGLWHHSIPEEQPPGQTAPPEQNVSQSGTLPAEPVPSDGSRLPGAGTEQSAPMEQTGDSPRPTQPEQIRQLVTFPTSLEQDRLEIASLFQFTGMNPDCGNAEGTDVAAIQLKNISGEHLAQLRLTVRLTSGRELTFTASDLPAGMSAMVFEQANTPMATGDACEELRCEAVFEARSPVLEDQLAIQVEESTVTLTNRTEQPMEAVTIYCHSMMEGESFGGLTYGYEAGSIAPGETVSVEALDCFLGEAAVVRVEAELR